MISHGSMIVFLETEIRDISKVQGLKSQSEEIDRAKCEVLEVRQWG